MTYTVDYMQYSAVLKVANLCHGLWATQHHRDTAVENALCPLPPHQLQHCWPCFKGFIPTEHAIRFNKFYNNNSHFTPNKNNRNWGINQLADLCFARLNLDHSRKSVILETKSDCSWEALVPSVDVIRLPSLCPRQLD